jgi:hypothetical protein
MTHHDEDVQNAERDRGHGEEVAGSDIGNVVIQKRSPRLGRRFPLADHILGHGLFGDVVAQEKQFRQDSWCAELSVTTFCTFLRELSPLSPSSEFVCLNRVA